MRPVGFLFCLGKALMRHLGATVGLEWGADLAIQVSQEIRDEWQKEKDEKRRRAELQDFRKEMVQVVREVAGNLDAVAQNRIGQGLVAAIKQLRQSFRQAGESGVALLSAERPLAGPIRNMKLSCVILFAALFIPLSAPGSCLFSTEHSPAGTIGLTDPKKTPSLDPPLAGVKLFADGTLKGWVEEQHGFFSKKNPGAKTWSVKDGVVYCDGSRGNCGFLRYDKKLSDFVLRLEYRMSKQCNSGVCIRVPTPYDGNPEKTLPSRTGYEIQILDDAGVAPSLGSTGSLYNLVAPKVNAVKPFGEWNMYEIECRGPKIRVTLNGQIVQDIDQTTLAAIRERPRTGYLMLQNHGHDVEFRNLRLLELKSPK